MTSAKRLFCILALAALLPSWAACAAGGDQRVEVIPELTLKPVQVTPLPAATPTPAPEPAQSPSPQPSPPPLSGYVIGIDPGHQGRSNSEQEPVSPGSSETKKKVSSGTQGRYTGVPEYEVVLEVGLLLRDLLESHGATVVMTREAHDVDISNAERARFFNDHETDYALRLHINGSDDPDKHGAFMLIPTENPYKEECERAAELLIDAFCQETGAKDLGLTYRSDQTGFNWCDRMIINIEMGHMTNRAEDELLVSSDYQRRMAQGLLNGILAYFNGDE